MNLKLVKPNVQDERIYMPRHVKSVGQAKILFKCDVFVQSDVQISTYVYVYIKLILEHLHRNNVFGCYSNKAVRNSKNTLKFKINLSTCQKFITRTEHSRKSFFTFQEQVLKIATVIM